MRKSSVVIMFAVLLSPLMLRAEEHQSARQGEAMKASLGDISEQSHFRKLIDEASDVYGSISKGPKGGVPRNVLDNARCVAVLPGVMTGALIVGGTHGEGIASCKAANGTWSQPAPISLNQGSIGLQAGVKSTDLVLFFQTRDAARALIRGNFALGADISAVAGEFDSSIDTKNAGVIVYARTEGMFAGAAVNGSKIGKDTKELAKYYGKNADYRAVLEGRESIDDSGYTNRFTNLLP
jgi:lipid-binding SYLF domain-containing protein